MDEKMCQERAQKWTRLRVTRRTYKSRMDTRAGTELHSLTRALATWNLPARRRGQTHTAETFWPALQLADAPVCKSERPAPASAPVRPRRRRLARAIQARACARSSAGSNASSVASGGLAAARVCLFVCQRVSIHPAAFACSLARCSLVVVVGRTEAAEIVRARCAHNIRVALSPVQTLPELACRSHRHCARICAHERALQAPTLVHSAQKIISALFGTHCTPNSVANVGRPEIIIASQSPILTWRLRFSSRWNSSFSLHGEQKKLNL